MSRLSGIFEKNKKCFIPFVTAGHPGLEMTRRIVLKLADLGSHIIEIGIPFSDPIADGPVIQRSSFQALEHGYTMADYIELVRQLRAKTDVGLIFMTYINPVLKYGLERLDKEASAAGLDGILISDLTPEEYQGMKLAAPSHSRLESPRNRAARVSKRSIRAATVRERSLTLDTVFLASPTSSDERLKKIAAVSRGFIYLVARTGVTGKASDVEALVPKTVARLRQYSKLPIAVGFGITSAEDVRKVWQYADGAVVGSAIVRFIDDHRTSPDLADEVADYVKTQLWANESHE